MGETLAAAIISFLGVGLAAIVLALLYPPTVGTREMVAYLTTMIAVGVGLVVANVWLAAGGSGKGDWVFSADLDDLREGVINSRIAQLTGVQPPVAHLCGRVTGDCAAKGGT